MQCGQGTVESLPASAIWGEFQIGGGESSNGAIISVSKAQAGLRMFSVPADQIFVAPVRHNNTL